MTQHLLEVTEQQTTDMMRLFSIAWIRPDQLRTIRPLGSGGFGEVGPCVPALSVFMLDILFFKKFGCAF